MSHARQLAQTEALALKCDSLCICRDRHDSELPPAEPFSGRTSESKQALHDDGSAANGTVLLPFAVDSPDTNDMRRLESLVWVIIVTFILVGAVLLPFRAFGAAWGLYRGSCEDFQGHDSRAANSACRENDPERRSSIRLSTRPAQRAARNSVPSEARREQGHPAIRSFARSAERDLTREYRALSAPDPSRP